MYFLGFITLLILGMAVRMLPGFLHQRQVASPALVEATFWLGNAAVLGRVLPFVLPGVVLQEVPASAPLARMAFALSGLLGLAAVWCLAVNLWKTVHKG
jgi:cbb3-type cytochrome oxidase subunit 1